MYLECNVTEDSRDQHRLQIWTQHEMLSGVFAGIVIGFALAIAFLKA